MRGTLTALLVLVVAYQAATVTWRLVAIARDQGEPTPLSPSVAPLPGNESQGLHDGAMNVTALTDQHLFGHADAPTNAPPPPAVDAQTAPPTTLPIALVGVFFSSAANKSMAIIAEQGKKTSEAIYGLGEALPGNAILSEIFRDHVILLRAGRHETLSLEAAAVASPLDQEATIIRRAPAKASAQLATAATASAQVQIDRDLWNQHLADLPALANEVGVEVYPPGGERQEGYRLLAKRDSRVMADLALQAGDVVVDINGMPLTNPSSAIQAYNTIKGAETITIQIMRDGRRQTKNYTIGQFSTSP